MLPLDPALHAEVIRRARRIASQCAPDPLDCALDIDQWLRSAMLDRRGWRAIVRNGRPALRIGKRVVALH